jgi:hypothetical protein
MTAGEFTAARDALAMTDEQVAADFGVTPAVVRAWATGTLRVPARHAQLLRWRVAGTQRTQALMASGLPECDYIRAWDAAPIPTSAAARTRDIEKATAHMEGCPVCLARTRFLEERFGAMPELPLPGWMRMVAWIDRLPQGVRPAVVGALILAGLVAVKILLAVPELVNNPGRLRGAFLEMLVAASAGAIGGFAYTVARPTLRGLGRVGDYLAGVVSVLAALTAIAVAAPIAFGRSLVDDGAGVLTLVATAMVVGTIIGHTWIRETGS